MSGSGALSLHLGLCGALGDNGPRLLPCTNRSDPAIMDEPEVITASVGTGGSDTTPIQSGSRSGALFDPNMQERKDEIDALRARVDVILNKMVQNSGDDVTRLRHKIAEMRTGPPHPPQAVVTKPPAPQKPLPVTQGWNQADPKNCPLSPMTTTTTTSATPSADTPLRANLSINKKQPIAQVPEEEPLHLTQPGSILASHTGSHAQTTSSRISTTGSRISTTGSRISATGSRLSANGSRVSAAGSLLTSSKTNEEEEGRDDDDDDIDDDIEFDFKVAQLSMSKSIQMNEIGVAKKEAKDPPASLTKTESMLPDPGGDDSYCSGGSSRAESPPPDSLLYEAAARKAESVCREREQQHQSEMPPEQTREDQDRLEQDRLEREQLQQQLLHTKQLLQKQQEQLTMQNQRKYHGADYDNQSRTSKTTHKSAKTWANPMRPAANSVKSRPNSIVHSRPATMEQYSRPAAMFQQMLVQPRPAPLRVELPQQTVPPVTQLEPQPQQPQPQPQQDPVEIIQEPVEIIDADEAEEVGAKPPPISVVNPQMTMVSQLSPTAESLRDHIPPLVDTTAINTAKIISEPEAVVTAIPDVINTEPEPVMKSQADIKVVDDAPVVNSDPQDAPVERQEPIEVQQEPIEVQQEPIEVPEQLERSRSPPPPVANVNIPHIGKSAISVASRSDSSLTRPPSPSLMGEITMVEEVSEQRIRDPYGDKGLYSGVLVKRRPHGRGTMKYDDGRHYEGHWNHGRWHGVGRAIFANNDIFEGSYDMDQRHGHGMYQWNDGRVYTGQFYQDQRQGRGTYTWPDGAVYQGEFKSGHRHGQGMYRFADGSVYTGEWENGKYHGVGECRWSDGRSYRGEWKEGRANGYGVETRPNGTIRHDGEWKDDRPIRDSKRKTTTS